MKILQTVALLLVGALGAFLYMKAGGDKAQPVPGVQTATGEAAAPAGPPAEPVAQPAPPAPTEPAPPQRVRPRESARPRPKETSAPPVAASTPAAAPAASAPPPAFTPTVTPAPPSTPSLPEKPLEPPPPPPPPRTVTLARGALIPVRLIESLSSDHNQPGDTFSATLDQELVVDGFVIAERGARVEGRVVESQRAGRVKGVSELSVELTQFTTSDGQRIRIQTESFAKQGPESKGSDAAKIGAGAAIGAAIGAIAGGGKGAAIGAGVGGAAGTGGVMATRGKAATLASETRISFRLSDPVSITERARKR